MSIALPFFPFFSVATSHTNTQTVRGRPTPKKEIRRFWNGLVRRLKVNKRKLLRQSKTLCSNWRKQVLESQGNTSYLEKILKTEMCKDFGNRRWLQQEWFERGAVVCIACRRSDRLSTRGSQTLLPWFLNRCDKHHYHCSSFSFVWKSRCFHICFCIVYFSFSCRMFTVPYLSVISSRYITSYR